MNSFAMNQKKEFTIVFVSGIIFLLIILPLLSYTQNRIEGIGPFKVGKTLSSQIPNFADTGIGNLQKKEPKVEGTEYWYAVIYEISGVWVQDLELTFYKDTLYEIQCEPTEQFIEALRAKYGRGITTIREKKITCITGLKITYSEVEKQYTVTYPTISKNIEATEFTHYGFDKECKKEHYHFFSIIHNKIYKQVDYIIRAAGKKKEDAELKKRKEALKDF